VRARVLQLSADRPDADALGGVQVHVAVLAEKAASEVTLHTAYPSGGELRVEQWGPRRLAALLPIQAAGRSGDEDSLLESALVTAIEGTQADVLHVHSPLLGARAIASAARRASVHVAVTLHDQALACENYDLLEGGEHFCDLPEDPSRCDRCLGKTRRLPPGAVLRHRDAMRELVSVAEAFVAPSDSVLELVRRVHPGVGDRARRIDWGVPEATVRSTRSADESGPLSIAVVGVLSREKGRDRLPELLAACHELPVTWHLFGATEGASVADVQKSAPHVIVHGAYRRRALAERLTRAGCHIALLPSIKPESFSLVLSEVMAAGLPVIASDLGALPERVVRQGLGWTFDPWAPATLSALILDLSTNRGRVDEAAARVRARPHRSEEAMADDHVALWTALRGLPGRTREEPGRSARGPWIRGAELAARGRSARLARLAGLVATLRRSDFYRDFPLRRALPESTRKTVEAAVARLLGGVGRR
jgi:glycosyltransferase involved in cell wall biosynthesis